MDVLLANSGAHFTRAWLRTGPESGVVVTETPEPHRGAQLIAEVAAWPS